MIERPQKVETHKFEIEGKRLLLDVRRSISMEIDEIASDVLDIVNGHPSHEINSTLQGKYSREWHFTTKQKGGDAKKSPP
ncbi:hypothetical protein J7K19_08455 [bacterium]|nr:hypothetical protein [bacterium]